MRPTFGHFAVVGMLVIAAAMPTTASEPSSSAESTPLEEGDKKKNDKKDKRWKAWGGDKANPPADIVGDGNLIMGRRKLWASDALPAPGAPDQFAFQQIDKVGKDAYQEIWTAHSGKVVLRRTFRQPKKRAFIPALAPTVKSAETFYVNGNPQSKTRYDRDGHIIAHEVFNPAGQKLLSKKHQLMELQIAIHDPKLQKRVLACPEGLTRNVHGPSARRGLHPQWSEYNAPLHFYCGADGVHEKGQELFVSLTGRVRFERIVDEVRDMKSTRRVRLSAWDASGKKILTADARWGIEGKATCRKPGKSETWQGAVKLDEEAPLLIPLKNTPLWDSGSPPPLDSDQKENSNRVDKEALACFEEALRWTDARSRPDGDLTLLKLR
jgi:hypothetical protein